MIESSCRPSGVGPRIRTIKTTKLEPAARVPDPEKRSPLPGRERSGEGRWPFVTSKRAARGETLLVCQKKNQSNGRAKMSAKARRLPHKQANSCAKKWNIFGKANMVLVRPSRQSPSVYQR